MTASQNLSKVEIRQRQTAAVKHGADGARIRLMKGQPFYNVAAEKYQQIIASWGYTDAELEQSGMFGDLVIEIGRHRTVSEMFYMLMLGAAADGDLDQWERFYKNWRTISGRSIKHMHELQAMIDNNQTLDYEQLLHSQSE